jgi:toxin ParE1/3/4
MALKVDFRPKAKADLFAPYEYIAAAAGFAVAGGYIDRIETACLSLATFPKRGARRDDISPGLRLVGFERRVMIAFRIEKKEVVIVRIFYGGRDHDSALRTWESD